ncbi:hypothetical protein [Actinomadura monticuli]|uniref:Guanylate cyclase domain-containing protein n=1 Tax=Actinomadura monticuli TaxID=3097367 RepID=A0ABV4Q753_9ACTN
MRAQLTLGLGVKISHAGSIAPDAARNVEAGGVADRVDVRHSEVFA